MSIATIRQYHLHKNNKYVCQLIFWAIHTFGSFELFERFGPFNFGNVEIANVGQRQKFEQIQRQCITSRQAFGVLWDIVGSWCVNEKFELLLSNFYNQM
ncbi:hypothetical protein T03_8130 [Trichinella britovi]|uniref:Uncharacterized protein n=1 Tax=Trichinella britovi TaxID=45882 RepID=A0A0V1CYJ8_TRIBR|nr:hypothetical protein T03_8130 [Trichinella britovi]